MTGLPSFLVVDDDAGIRSLVQVVLRRQQYAVAVAADGREAIEMLRDRRYDALFLDLMMPICNGHQVLAFLQEQQIVRKCVVVMTAAGARQTRELDTNLVHRVLHKPFDLRDLIASAAGVLLEPSIVLV